MEYDLAFGLRNLFVFGALFTTATFVPEASLALTRFFRGIRSRLGCYRRSLRDAFRAKAGSRFWEIDMTKFEP